MSWIKNKAKKRQNKKSQATIFMIVGLVIVIGAGIFFYSTQKAQQQFVPEIKIVNEQIPTELDPIKKYASDCVYSTALQGLNIIGSQGGYISLTNRSLNRQAFALSFNPTESDAVYFTKDSQLKIPYWWYLKSPNGCNGNCEFASRRPDLRQSENSIEKQLERHIDSRFEECLDNFEPFNEQGFKVSKKGKVKSDVTIASDDIVVTVEYPVYVEKIGSKAEITQFTASMQLNLERIYDLSTKITNMEIKHRYLEKHILNLISAFSGVDKGKLPPMSDMQFEFGRSLSWQKSDVRDKITGLLTSYVPLFQVDGTYNYQRDMFNSELKQRLYDSTIIPVTNSSFEDLSADFTYLDFWPAYFDLNCKGEKCAPSSATSMIPLVPFGIQSYKFAYDLSFPVMVEVSDPFALNGQGYSFRFFLEGNIRNNRHMEADYDELKAESVSEQSQLCDARTSNDVEIKVLDSISKIPLADAQIMYTLTGESCFIGVTNNEGTLVEKLPIGIGGSVNIVKEGYIGKSVEFDASLDAKESVSAEITPISTKKIIVKKKSIIKALDGWEFKDEALDLNGKESAFISLERISDGTELDFSAFANYEGQKEAAEAEVAPGSYSAEIKLTLNERIVIPEKEECEGSWPVKKCYIVPRIDFAEKATAGEERFNEGGSKLNITIPPGDYSTIVLYAISIDIANVPEADRVVEDVEQINKVEEYSAKYSSALQPTFEK